MLLELEQARGWICYVQLLGENVQREGALLGLMVPLLSLLPTLIIRPSIHSQGASLSSSQPPLPTSKALSQSPSLYSSSSILPRPSPLGHSAKFSL